MKARKVFLYGLFSAAVLASANALARHHGCDDTGPHPGQHMHGRMLDRMADRLDLTEQQQEQIRSITESSRERLSDTREAMKAGRKQIKSAVEAGATEGEVQQLLIGQSAHKAKAVVERARVRREIQAVLTEEQREAFVEMQAKRKARMEKRAKPRD